MREIEVKAKVSDPEALLASLAERAIKLGPPIIQKDIIFAEDVARFTEFSPNVNFLRIREQDGKFLLTLKRSELNETESIEHETEISNQAELTAIINWLGFEEAVRVNKKRRKARCQDLEICFDEVEGIGTFIEVEKLTEEGDILSIQQELFGFLQELGVKESDRVTQGYDTLVRIKMENKS